MAEIVDLSVSNCRASIPWVSASEGTAERQDGRDRNIITLCSVVGFAMSAASPVGGQIRT
jgi:hypothetical protein